MLKLLKAEDMVEPLTEFGRKRPIFGTGAGAILLAKEVTPPGQPGLGLMDMTVERNGYGRQVDSRMAEIAPESEFAQRTLAEIWRPCLFERPSFVTWDPDARVLATYQGDPVLVEEGRHLVATFHPGTRLATPGYTSLFLSKL